MNWAERTQALAKIGAFDHLPIRLLRAEDIAQSIVCLIGNTFMTGCVLECDGGLRLVGQAL